MEARTNAANMSAVWKYLKLSERETQTSLQARNTDSERLLHLMSPMRRGRGGCCWLLWWLKSWNGLKWLVNKLQNVMFSKTRTNCMYSNSAAQTHGARVQSPKHEEILALKHLLIICLIFLFILSRVTMWYVWQTSSQNRNEIYLRNICMLLSTKRSTEVFLRVSAKIKAPSTFIHFRIVILLLFCKIK